MPCARAQMPESSKTNNKKSCFKFTIGIFSQYLLQNYSKYFIFFVETSKINLYFAKMKVNICYLPNIFCNFVLVMKKMIDNGTDI